MLRHPPRQLCNLTSQARLLVQGEIHHQGYFLDPTILQGHHLLLMGILLGVWPLKLLLTWKRNYARKRRQSALGLMRQVMRSVMIESNQDNVGLIITSKNIVLVEMLDEEIKPQAKTLLPLIPRRKIADHPPQETHALEDMIAQGAVDHGPAGAQDRNDDEEARLKSKRDHDRKRERVSEEQPKAGGGGIPPPHRKNKNQKDMWKTGINPSPPIQLKQRQRNLNKRIRHHCHHQLQRHQRGRQQPRLYNRQVPNQFRGSMLRRCQL